MNRSFEKLSLKELIGYSIEAEKNTRDIYTQISKSLPELMSNRFKSLADEEDMHRQQLLKMYEKLFGDREYMVQLDDMPALESEVTSKSIGDLLEALGTAIENEKNSYQLYKHASKRYKKHRIYFEYLAVMEHGHLESLMKEKKLIEGEIVSRSRAMERTPESFFNFEFEKRQIQ